MRVRRRDGLCRGLFVADSRQQREQTNTIAPAEIVHFHIGCVIVYPVCVSLNPTPLKNALAPECILD